MVKLNLRSVVLSDFFSQHINFIIQFQLLAESFIQCIPRTLSADMTCGMHCQDCIYLTATSLIPLGVA